MSLYGSILDIRWYTNLAKDVFMGILLPARGGGGGWFGRIVRWVLHAVILGLVVWFLYWLNGYTGLERYVRAPAGWLRQWWLPLLFLLIYAMAWLGYWLYRLLLAGVAGGISRFPDLDLAWDEAKRALRQSGLELTELPIFWILGQNTAGEKTLFAASGRTLAVKQVPRRIDSPIYVYADNEGIFLTCNEASLMGRQCALLNAAAEAAAVPEQDLPASPDDVAARLRQGGGGKDKEKDKDKEKERDPDLEDDEELDQDEAMDTVEDMGEVITEDLELNPEDVALDYVDSSDLEGVFALAEPDAPVLGDLRLAGRSVREFLGGETGKTSARTAAASRQYLLARPSLLQDNEETEYLSARLRHLCRLVSRDRQPYCSANGILVIIPFAATDSDNDAKQTAMICQRDLATIQESLLVQCPVVTLVSDMEREPGFRELIRHVSEERRQRYLGLKFPLIPEMDATERMNMIERGVRWIASTLIPTLVYKLWRLGEDVRPAKAVAVAAEIDERDAHAYAGAGAGAGAGGRAGGGFGSGRGGGDKGAGAYAGAKPTETDSAIASAGAADELQRRREITQYNADLYQLIRTLRTRWSRLARIVNRGILPPSKGSAGGGAERRRGKFTDGSASSPSSSTTMLGGCYFAATGRDPEIEQGFVAGVFRRLIENQNYVSWTTQALDDDDRYRRWIRRGYAVLTLFLMVIAALAFAVFRR